MKQLLILSGKGGTGKTTIASAFIKLLDAKAYADCDVDAPNLHLTMSHKVDSKNTNYYGLPKAEINMDLCTECGLCKEKCRFEAININDGYKVDYYACEGCGVCEFVCPANAISLNPAVIGDLKLFKDEKLFSTAKLKTGNGNSGLLVTEVKKQLKTGDAPVDLAIIDGSPGIGCPVIASLSGVDMALIVAEPSISGISDMKRIIKTAQKLQTKILVCVNKYDINIKNTEKIELFCKDKNIPFIGKIPFDSNVINAINNGYSIVDVECDASDAIKKIYNIAMKNLNIDVY